MHYSNLHKIFIMKKLLLVFYLGLVWNLTFGQNAFYNAIKIYNLKPAQVPAEAALLQEKLDSFKQHPFRLGAEGAALVTSFLDAAVLVSKQGEVTVDEDALAEFLDRVNKLKAEGGVVSTESATGGNTASFLLSWESALIDGTAKFIAERFREDITRLYIDKFRARLGDVAYLDKLLPKTEGFLLEADVFNYQELGNDFKDAFEQDLENMLRNVRDLIETDTVIPRYLNKDLRNAFVFSLDLSDRLINEYHPIEILDYLEQRYKLKAAADTTYQGYFDLSRGLNLLQLHLQQHQVEIEADPGGLPPASEGKQKYEDVWLPYESLKWLNTPEEVIYFSAFLYFQDRSFFKRIFEKILEQEQTSVEAFQISNDPTQTSAVGRDLYEDFISPIVTLLNDIEKVQEKDKLTGDDYAAIIQNFVGILEVLGDLGVDWGNNFLLFQDEGEKLLEKVIDVYRSIYRKDYAYLVSSGSYVIAALLEDALAQQGDTATAKVIQLLQAYKKYSSFMVDIVTADNSDDVKEVIKRHVTKFSYLDKRQNRFSITVSAHPGLLLGLERLSETTNFKGNVGITAPIGFELAWGHRQKDSLLLRKSQLSRYEFVSDKKLHSFKNSYTSLFFSVLDIGAVFNYRLQDSESELPQNITLEQVFAPGIALQHGFKNSPLSLGFGVQYTPALRKVTSANIETDRNSFRIQARLSWDIPLVKLGAWRWKKINYKSLAQKSEKGLAGK